MRIMLKHLRTVPVAGRRAGYCVQGAKLLCQRYDLDWQTIKRDGIEESDLLAIGDALAVSLVEHARKLEHG